MLGSLLFKAHRLPLSDDGSTQIEGLPLSSRPARFDDATFCESLRTRKGPLEVSLALPYVLTNRLYIVLYSLMDAM